MSFFLPYLISKILFQIVLMDPMKLKMMGKVKKPMVVSSRVICSQRLKRVCRKICQ